MAIPFTPLTFSNNMPSGYALDENFADIKSALQSALSREHSNDNEMKVDLDMNARRILNLPQPKDTSEAARLADVQSALSGGGANLITFTPYDFITAEEVQTAIEQTADRATATKDTVEDATFGLNERVLYVDTIADLQALPVGELTANQGAYITTTGRSGLFVWKTGDQSASVSSDPQQGVWAAPSSDATGVSGAWKREYTDNVSFEWWGISESNTPTDNATARRGMTTYLKSVSDAGIVPPTIVGPNGVYQFDDTWVVGFRIRTDLPHRGVTFKKTTHALGGANNVDAILYLDDTLLGSAYLGNVHLKGINFEGPADTDRAAYGIYAPKITQNHWSHFRIRYCTEGVNVGNGWLCSAQHVEVGYCNKCWEWLGGTSFRGENLWSRDFDSSGYHFYGMNYSTLVSCGADNGTTSNVTAYHIDVGSDMTLIGCAAENISGRRLRADFSYVTVMGWDDYQCSGNDINTSGAIQAVGASCRMTLINSKFNDFTIATTQLNIKVENDAKIQRIETKIPTNGGSFPGTTNPYGIKTEADSISLMQDGVSASLSFGRKGSAQAQNGTKIAHGLGKAPSYVNVIGEKSGTNISIILVDTTDIQVGMRDVDGVLVTTNERVYWEAQI